MSTPSFCARCLRQNGRIQRHHVAYEKHGLELVVYLCASCHEAITNVNRFLWGTFQDTFRREPNGADWLQVRAFVFARFQQTTPASGEFATVDAIKAFVTDCFEDMDYWQIVESA